MEHEPLENHLELVSTAALQAELFRRFDHLIFYGVKHRPTLEQPNNHVVSWQHEGDMYKCIGLCCRMIAYCNAEIDKITEEIATDDL